MRRARLLGIALLALAAIAAASALWQGGGTARGVVVAVEATALDDVRGFTIRTGEGETLRFALGILENAAEFPPGHLTEHIVSGVPVIVTYRDVNGTATAYRIEDDTTP